MKKKLFIYQNILLLILFSNLPFVTLYSTEIDPQNKITVDFLNQLPSNDYIIGPGDQLNIIISRDIDLSSTVTVDGEGTITLPRLERIYVNGLTINELNSILNEAYLKFLKFPAVETIVTKYRPIRVFVDGEVVNPGLQRLEGSLSFRESDNNKEAFVSTAEETSGKGELFFPTIFDAIRSSGGITQFSDLKNVQVIRKESISNGAGSITTTLNFEDLLLKGENRQNIRLYDSDIIKIPRKNQPNKNILTKAILSRLNPRFIDVFVSGRVNRPGLITLSRVSVLSDAIDMAGGAKVLKGPITFIRFESDGTVDKRKLRLTSKYRGKFRNPNLREGDVIIVGNSVLTAANEVIGDVTDPFIGIFSTYGLIKAISD
ncbi:hypothetical protein CUB78_06720 [Prochlorococcus marinus str. XMU1401]|uniref:Soluble ligand binding domain-containing protein n=1 Tax=Prochlorococcus marinus str. XMU1401 TaxID=2052594 RepID=A0A8I2BKI3_PROMR|nr:polysaccharide biosynthesis/export family protein [Prochlorococcus marinus]MBO8223296.1 hypothetical protein [Prochlorococcus marinus str. XMU1401]MBW3059828.1 hypothetical protein [Prochlorococcus marinus str. XMU1401E]MCQ9198946.1 polysaccharide biosynthesis/export family protein [Prochlorococcus marinus XMU1429]PJC83642.1 hypothetical protein CUB78_06720 [Prochlorococcus marinus str. XMU1401]